MKLNEIEFHGKKIVIEEAKTKADHDKERANRGGPRRGRNMRGGRGGGRRGGCYSIMLFILFIILFILMPVHC